MAKSNSFDITCTTDMSEVQNAVHQTMKEVRQRFDFKDSASRVSTEDGELVLISDDRYRLESLKEILTTRLAKRGVSLKALTPMAIEDAAGGLVRQRIQIQQGIPTEKAKEIIKLIKGMKLKVQASLQGDTVRVSGKNRDDLQAVISRVKEEDLGIEVQFTNYRTT